MNSKSRGALETVRAIVRKTLTVVRDGKGAEVRYELIYADEVAETGRSPC